MGHLSKLTLLVLGFAAWVVGMGVMVLWFYILPYLVFDMQYQVPDYIIDLLNYVNQTYGVRGWILDLWIIIPMALIIVLSLLIAALCSRFSENKQDNQDIHTYEDLAKANDDSEKAKLDLRPYFQRHIASTILLGVLIIVLSFILIDTLVLRDIPSLLA